MSKDEILKKYEDDREYHFHQVDREWIMDAMQEYADQQVHISILNYNKVDTNLKYFTMGKDKGNKKSKKALHIGVVSGSVFKNCKHLNKKEVYRDYPDAYIEFKCLECGEMIYEDMYND